MQRKDLALRVLSTAAIMSIVTSIAAPAFAGTYYMANGNLSIRQDENGKVYVKSGDTDEKEDLDGEVVIRGGVGENQWSNAPSGGAATATGTEGSVAGEGASATGNAEDGSAPAAAAATGTEGSAAGESQPDPDAAFTLSEAEEDSAQTQEGKDTTEEKKDPAEDSPKEDVVYQYDPADPNPEQQATKPALSTPEEPEATAPEATQANAPAADPTTPTAPAADPPAEGSVKNPTTNVINVVNNWVGKAAKELKIRLSNVNIKVSNREYGAAMDISGGGKTKIELDGQNRLDNSQAQANAGLRKQGEGTLTITDETDDNGNKITAPKSGDSGSLTAKGATSNGSAGIGGKTGESTKNIIIEGYATVDATGGGQGAGIGGGGGTAGHVSGDAENIIIRGHSKVTATAGDGAAIGGGSANGSGNDYVGGSAKGIVIRDYATVVAKNNGYGAAIGAAGGSGNHTEAVVTIGTPGATTEDEDVNIIATGFYGSAIGNGAKDTKVTIQGHATVQTASSQSPIAIGSYYGNVEVNIKDNASIDTATGAGASGIGGGDFFSHPEKSVVVTINGGENGKIEIGKNSAITGKFGAISGTEVNIGNNVLLKMKPWKSPDDKYINVNGAEAAVGTRNNPAAGGLVNTIGDNTELWYTDYNGVLQKIVHSKNLCTKHETDHKDANCTENGWVKYECTFESNKGALHPEHKDPWTENTAIDPNAHDYQNDWTVTTPATGHHWKDNGDGTHTCPDCGATEGQPVNTNSALELRVVDAEGMDQPFTVSQNGTLRTYTGAYDTATLTGDLDTLRYPQEHGAQTIQFVTNGQTSSFAINDLLAQGSGSEVFYLTHRGAEEPTLLLVEADHSDLVKD